MISGNPCPETLNAFAPDLGCGSYPVGEPARHCKPGPGLPGVSAGFRGWRVAVRLENPAWYAVIHGFARKAANA